MSERSALLDALLEREVVGAGVAPAATVAVARKRGDRWERAFGAAGVVGPLPTDVDTPFDLASVTKPFVAVTLARLVEQGLCAWEQPLSDLLPWTTGTPAGGRTLGEHLSHRAGLRAHVELFAPVREGRPFERRTALERAARSVRPDFAGDALYSDLGYILVGAALEGLTSLPLDELIAEQLEPLGFSSRGASGSAPGSASGPTLGSSRQVRRRDPAFLERVAPTEHVLWRGGILRGVVHDDNAWALGGYGCSGHAGLFGSATAVLQFGMALLDALEGSHETLLSQRSLIELLRPRPGGTHRVGFDGKADATSMAGSLAGPRTFGHLGYTGTSFWCDPDARVVTVLLTNRVHPSAANRRIREARPRLQDALFQLTWNEGVPSPPGSREP